jgi:hypothetical protein
MKIIVGPMIDNNLNKFCRLLEMSKINYDCLLTEIILLYNSQRINENEEAYRNYTSLE